MAARADDAQLEQAEIGHGTRHHADILAQLRLDQKNDRPCAQGRAGVICSGSGHLLFRFTQDEAKSLNQTAKERKPFRQTGLQITYHGAMLACCPKGALCERLRL
jgi:hypothetical protein